MWVACSPEIDKKRFDNVDHATRVVERSIAAGEGYQQIGESVRELSSEIASLRDVVRSKKEKELLKVYSELLTMYQDGLLLWKYKIEFTRHDFVPKGRIYVGQDIEPIVVKYQLPTESHIFVSTRQSWKSISEDSIQIIWFNAHAQLETINSLLKS